MIRIVFAAALALAVTLPAVQAQAQSTRTFVSTAGSDTNPCTITQPCRHFQAAVNVTPGGGEVVALDPGTYGSFTISQTVGIEGQGWSYIAPPAGGAAITINAPVGDNVYIRGVSLSGSGTANATGIQFNSGTKLVVRDSDIRNFSAGGILYQPNSSGLSGLYISNTYVAKNGGFGINIQPAGSGATKGFLDRVEMANNAGDGLDVSTNTQTVNITMTDSVSANNDGTGVLASSLNLTTVSVFVRNSTIANNGANGLEADGTGGQIFATRSTITGNNTGWSVGNNGVVSSWVDNNIDANGNGNTPPPAPFYGYK